MQIATYRKISFGKNTKYEFLKEEEDCEVRFLEYPICYWDPTLMETLY